MGLNLCREPLSAKSCNRNRAVSRRRMCHVAKLCRVWPDGPRQIVPLPSIACLPSNTVGIVVCLPTYSLCRVRLSAFFTLPSARVLALGEDADTRRIRKFQ